MLRIIIAIVIALVAMTNSAHAVTCADGWVSPSSGRGACSHHGGIATGSTSTRTRGSMANDLNAYTIIVYYRGKAIVHKDWDSWKNKNFDNQKYCSFSGHDPNSQPTKLQAISTCRQAVTDKAFSMGFSVKDARLFAEAALSPDNCITDGYAMTCGIPNDFRTATVASKPQSTGRDQTERSLQVEAVVNANAKPKVEEGQPFMTKEKLRIFYLTNTKPLETYKFDGKFCGYGFDMPNVAPELNARAVCMQAMLAMVPEISPWVVYDMTAPANCETEVYYLDNGQRMTYHLCAANPNLPRRRGMDKLRADVAACEMLGDLWNCKE